MRLCVQSSYGDGDKHSGPFFLPSRREVQEYIPALLYHTMAGSAWLNLVSQHRQQTQALSPHQARAQFLGKSPGLGEIIMGGFAEEGVLEGGDGDTFFLCTKAFSVLAKQSCLKKTLF